MVFSHFTIQILFRLGLLLANFILLAFLLLETSYLAVIILMGAVAIGQTVALFRLISRTNRELTRFLSAIRYEDYLRTSSIEHLGSSFAGLNKAFDEVMKRFRDARGAHESQSRYFKTLLEHMPVAILSVHGDGRVELLNNAARRLLNESGPVSLEDLIVHGSIFQRDVFQSKAGDRKLTRTESDGVKRQLILSTTQVTLGKDTRRLITLQDIQSELDATELSAWQDMVRVLSHEIMNSITPIASLARTVDDLVNDLARKTAADTGRDDEEIISDLRSAVHTVARRSDGLMEFVQSYRQLTQMPPPKMKQISLSSYLTHMGGLMNAEWAGRGITLHRNKTVEGLLVVADENLLDQAIINLMRNAADAASENEAPRVWIGAQLNARGNVVLEVADNGQGIPPDLREKIFLPFFTTKSDGSGIGLSLARQVMLVHKGAISASPREGGGTVFRLTF